MEYITDIEYIFKGHCIYPLAEYPINEERDHE